MYEIAIFFYSNILDMKFINLCLSIPNLDTIVFYIIFVILIPLYLFSANDYDSLKYYLPAFELMKHQLPEGGKNQVIALVDIGASITRINIIHDGESVYARDQPFGGDQLTQEIQNQFNLSVEEAEAAKRKGTYRKEV
jgi:actin-related protein